MDGHYTTLNRSLRTLTTRRRCLQENTIFPYFLFNWCRAGQTHWSQSRRSISGSVPNSNLLLCVSKQDEAVYNRKTTFIPHIFYYNVREPIQRIGAKAWVLSVTPSPMVRCCCVYPNSQTKLAKTGKHPFLPIFFMTVLRRRSEVLGQIPVFGLLLWLGSYTNTNRDMQW